MIESLYFIVLVEAVVGGGGQIFPIGPITIRIALFVGCLVLWLITASTKKRKDGQLLSFVLIYSFIFSLLPGSFIDAMNGVPIDQILYTIEPLLFFLSAPFVALAVQNTAIVEKSAKIVIYGGFLVSLITISITIFLSIGLLPFEDFYRWGASSGEIYFRTPTLFFFKGHFYVGLSLIFALVLKPRYWALIASILALALVLSLTRGFILAALVAFIFSQILLRQRVSLLVITIVGLSIGGAFFSDILGLLNPNSGRFESIAVRLRDQFEFVDNFDFSMLFFGEGAGALLNGRQNIENSFLWAFWRFGIFGLAFWLLPLFLCAKYYFKIWRNSVHFKLSTAYFCGMVFSFLVSSINPFINNSIGISFTLLGLFSLRRIYRSSRGE